MATGKLEARLSSAVSRTVGLLRGPYLNRRAIPQRCSISLNFCRKMMCRLKTWLYLTHAWEEGSDLGSIQWCIVSRSKMNTHITHKTWNCGNNTWACCFSRDALLCHLFGFNTWQNESTVQLSSSLLSAEPIGLYRFQPSADWLVQAVTWGCDCLQCVYIKLCWHLVFTALACWHWCLSSLLVSKPQAMSRL